MVFFNFPCVAFTVKKFNVTKKKPYFSEVSKNFNRRTIEETGESKVWPKTCYLETFR